MWLLADHLWTSYSANSNLLLDIVEFLERQGFDSDHTHWTRIIKKVMGSKEVETQTDAMEVEVPANGVHIEAASGVMEVEKPGKRRRRPRHRPRRRPTVKKELWVA